MREDLEAVAERWMEEVSYVTARAAWPGDSLAARKL